jgi:maltose alpha-D-glucosyltransferase/alpha-amylase
MMQYGDEIGMGDDLRLPGRECARTPMQWSAEHAAGFSTARTLVHPVITDAVFGYETVNVAAQRRDPASLLNWTERVIRARKECPEITWGDFQVLRTNVPEVLAVHYEWHGTGLVTLHNFSDNRRRVTLKIPGPHGDYLAEIFDGRHSRGQNDGAHRITLDPYAWRWYRVGAADTTLQRAPHGLAGQ